MDFESELARCDLEISEVYNGPAEQGHWLQLLAIADWETGKRLILKEGELYT